MFCRNCGTEIDDTAKFCPKCGKAVVAEKEVVEDNIVKLQIKPKFNIGYKILKNLSPLIIVLIFSLIFLFPLFTIFIIFPQILLAIIVIIVVCVIGIMVIDKKQYDNMEYNFYNTKVEYKDGFLNKEEKELKYKSVREVTMTQGILERMFGLGTIRIYTNASSAVYSQGSHTNMQGINGIFIHCVENVEEQYKLIKQIIDNGTVE